MATPPFDREEHEAMLRAQASEASMYDNISDGTNPEDFFFPDGPEVPQNPSEPPLVDEPPQPSRDALSQAIYTNTVNSEYVQEIDTQYFAGYDSPVTDIDRMLSVLEGDEYDGMRDSMRMAMAYESLAEYEGISYNQQNFSTSDNPVGQDTSVVVNRRQSDRVFATLDYFGNQDGTTLPPKELLQAPTFQSSPAINSREYNVLKSSIDTLPAHIKLAVLDEIAVNQNKYADGAIPFDDTFRIAVDTVSEFEREYSNVKSEGIRPAQVAGGFISDLQNKSELMGIEAPDLNTDFQRIRDADTRVSVFDMPNDFLSHAIESEAFNSKYLNEVDLQYAGNRIKPADDMKRIGQALQSQKATNGMRDSMRLAVAYESLSDYERVSYIQQNPNDDPDNAEIFTNAIKQSRLLATLQYAENSGASFTDLPPSNVFSNNPLQDNTLLSDEQRAVLTDAINTSSPNVAMAIYDEIDNTQKQTPSGSISFEDAFQVATHTASEFETNYNNLRLDDMKPSRETQNFLDNIKNKANIAEVELPVFKNDSLQNIQEDIIASAPEPKTNQRDIISYASNGVASASTLINNFGDGSSSVSGISKDAVLSNIQDSITKTEELKSEGVKDSMRLALNYATISSYQELSLKEVSENPAPLSFSELKNETRSLDANAVSGIYKLPNDGSDPTLSTHSLPPEFFLSQQPYESSTNMSDDEKMVLRESLDTLNPSLRLAVLEEMNEAQELKPNGNLDFRETLHVAVKTVEDFDDKFNNIKPSDLKADNKVTDFRLNIEELAGNKGMDLPLVNNQTLEEYKKTMADNTQKTTPNNKEEPSATASTTPEVDPSVGPKDTTASSDKTGESDDNTEAVDNNANAEAEGNKPNTKADDEPKSSNDLDSEVSLLKDSLGEQDYYKNNPDDLKAINDRLDEVGQLLGDVDIPNSMKVAVMNHDLNTLAHEQVFEKSLKLKNSEGGTFHSHFTPLTKEKSKAVTEASKNQYMKSKFAEPYVSSHSDLLDSFDLNKDEAKILDTALRRTSLGARLHAYEELNKAFGENATDNELEPNFKNVTSVVAKAMAEIDTVHELTSPQYKRSKSALDSFKNEVSYLVSKNNKGKSDNLVDDPKWLNSIDSRDVNLEDITPPTNLKGKDSKETLQSDNDNKADNTEKAENEANDTPKSDASKPTNDDGGKSKANKGEKNNNADGDKPESSQKNKSNSSKDEKDEKDEKKPNKKKQDNEEDEKDEKEAKTINTNTGTQFNFSLFNNRRKTTNVNKTPDNKGNTDNTTDSEFVPPTPSGPSEPNGANGDSPKPKEAGKQNAEEKQNNNKGQKTVSPIVDLKDDFLNDSLSGLQSQHTKLMEAYDKKEMPDEYLYEKTEEFLKNADEFANSVDSNSRTHSNDLEQQKRLVDGMKHAHDFKQDIKEKAENSGFLDDKHPLNKKKKEDGSNTLKDSFDKSKEFFQNVGQNIMSFMNKITQVVGALRGKK